MEKKKVRGTEHTTEQTNNPVTSKLLKRAGSGNEIVALRKVILMAQYS